MPDIGRLMEMLRSTDSSQRYRACEELRIVEGLTSEVLEALQQATKDTDPLVAAAASNALAARSVAMETRSMPGGEPNSPEYVLALERRVADLEGELRRVAATLVRTEDLSRSTASRIPYTMIIAPRFLPRAFAVWGHAFVAGLLISIPLYCVAFVMFLLRRGGY